MPASVPSASTRPRETSRARPAWPPGLRAMSSTSAAPLRWPTAGWLARIGYSTRSSREPSTAGLRSSRASWRTRVARRRRRQSSGAVRPSSGGGSTCPTWRCSGSHSRVRRWWRPRGWSRACGASTRQPRLLCRARQQSRSRVRGRAAFWSPPAPPCATIRGRSNGATGLPSSLSATGAATCSPSAARSTAPCTCGAAGGERRKQCWRPRSRTSPDPARRWWADRSWGWPS